MNWILRTRCRVIAAHLYLAFALVVVLVACAPATPTPRTFTVGILNLSPITETVYDGFKARMQELGYVEGQNIQYIYHEPTPDAPPPPNSLLPAAQTLADARVDLILSITTPASDSAKEATAGTDLPVIFYGIRDPREAGYVEDLQHPGGNMTGITVGIEGTPTEGRRLEWLKQLVPDLDTVYLPYNPNDALVVQSVETVREAAANLGIELLLHEAPTAEEAQAAIESIPAEADAIFPVAALADHILAVLYPQVGEIALERKLPFSTPARALNAGGVLMSFGPEYEAIGRQAAGMADQILKGAKPADLPVEIPEFFLTINLVTAEAIGLEIPDALIQQADFVIRPDEG